MNADRIIELEIKTAYQEDLFQALNKIVGNQQQQIDRLEAAAARAQTKCRRTIKTKCHRTIKLKCSRIIRVTPLP